MLELAASNTLIRVVFLLGIFALVTAITLGGMAMVSRRMTVRAELRKLGGAAVVPSGATSLRSAGADGAWARLAESVEAAGLNLADTKDERLSAKLRQAGFTSPAAPRIFTLIRLGLVFILPAGYVLLSYAGGELPGFMKLYIVGSILALAGLYLPNLVVQARADRRREAIVHGFPDCLDLLLVCVESGLGAGARAMLAQASMADVIMAPAADMFELGVDVQVLRRGTLFAIRAKKLYEIYRAYPSLEAVPAAERAKIEKDMLRASFDEAWASTRAFWSSRDPSHVARAESDPKHRMALVFRSYLGLSSRWAIDGVSERLTDYQIWCGPAMGAFNTWAAGSFLEAPERRTAVQVALNLLEGAAVLTRAQQLRTFGLAIPPSAFDFRPRPLA